MKNTLKKAMGVVLVIALLLGVLVVPSQDAQAASKKVSITQKAKVTVGKTVKIKLKNNKKKVKWKVVKGKKLIQLAKKTKTYVKVKGVKKGTAKVQAVVGKKKYSCKVTVSAAEEASTVNNKPQAAKTPVPTTSPSGNTKATTTPVLTSSPSGNVSATPIPTPTESPSGDILTTTEPTSSPDVTPGIYTIIYDGTNESEIDEAEELEKPYAIIIKDGIEYIESYDLFNDRVNLISIEIPASMKGIGSDDFSGCSSLKKIKVSDENTVYDSRNNCNAVIETTTNTLIFGCMTTVIPSSVTSIGEFAFDHVSLTGIEIPGGITNIGSGAFNGCNVLDEIKVSAENTVYDSRDNCNAIIETATNTLTAGCKSTVIPDSVTSIGEFAFYNCSSLVSIEIPATVTNIEYGAFIGCSSLTSIEIPNSVTSIGGFAFMDCGGLNEIKVSIENTVYDSRDNCNAIIETATNILITGCNTTVVPDSVTGIGDRAFWDCNDLKSITIPASVTWIGDRAFANSGLTSMIIEGMADTTEMTFWGCDTLRSITWNGTTYYNADQFMNAYYESK